MTSRGFVTAMWRTLLGSVLAVGLMLVPATAQAGNVKVTSPDPALTALWWQTFLALPGTPNPLDRCDLGTGKITFLAGSAGPIGGPAGTRTCTIPKNKYFLVPLINVECSQGEGNGDDFAELSACTEGYVRGFTNLSLTIDGTPVPDLTQYRVQSDLFRFDSPADNAFGIGEQTNNLALSDGYWVLIKLTPGQHTVSFGGDFPEANFTTSVTYELTVKK